MRYSYSDVDKKNHEWFQNDLPEPFSPAIAEINFT